MSKIIAMRITILLLFISTIGFSQANFLPRGESGGLVNLSLVTGASQTDLFVGGGYSPNGVFDISGGITRATYDNDIGLTGASSLDIVSQLRYFVVKENDLPIQVAVAGYGSIGSLNSDETDIADIDVSVRNFGGGVESFFDIESHSRVNVQPFAGIYYNYIQLEFSQNGQNTAIDTDNTDVFFTLGANIVIDTDYNRFNIAPSLSFVDSDTRFGISFDYIFD